MVDWEASLITLYLLICKTYEETLWVDCQRLTNGGKSDFSDEEVMTLYFFGIFRGLKEKTAIHRYANDHLKGYFPALPQYGAFVHRVNRLNNAFRGLIEVLQSQRVPENDEGVYLIDSFPIALAQGNHAYTAKVAPMLASRSYCATKKMYYHGVKAHVVARKRPQTLPDVEILMIEEAARHDTPVFQQIRPLLHDNVLFGDQAYNLSDADEIEMTQSLKVFTPIKKEKGQKKLNFQQRTFSNAVSRMRQPIETLFGWINKMTGIENASTVRSASGLLSHIFGRFAAAMLIRSYPEFDF